MSENSRNDVFTSQAPQPLNLIGKGSPLDWRSEAKRRDREALEFVQRHFRETGYLPKEYEMRRASDPAFDKAEAEAAMAQYMAAMERLRAWEAYWRDVRQYNIREQNAWRETWTEQAVRDSLGGVMDPLLARAKKLGPEQEAKANNGLTDLIRHILSPSVGPVQTAERVKRFIQMAYEIRGVLESNMINKLSELVSAKALWFANDMPLRLLPGPAAVGGSDSPDYVDENAAMVGDNFRVSGVKTGAVTVLLNPDPQNKQHAGRMNGVKSSVIKGIKDKFFTYQKKWLDGKGYRMVVTVDVSESPWILGEAYLQDIRATIRTWLPAESRQLVLEVFLIVSGIPRRIWPHP